MVVRFQYHIALEFAFPGCLSWVLVLWGFISSYTRCIQLLILERHALCGQNITEKNRMSSDGEGTSRQNPFPQATGSTGLIATEAAAEQWSIHNLLKFLFLNLESAYAKVFDSLNLPIVGSMFHGSQQ